MNRWPGWRAGLALLPAAAGCTERSPRAEVDSGPLPAEHTEGERLFSVHCARCHGQAASGTAGGPPLVHAIYEPNHHADEAFQRAVRFGVQPHHWNFGPMLPVEGLGRAEVDRITGYVRWLQRQAGIY